MTELHPLLAAACARHAIPTDRVVALATPDGDDPLRLHDGDAPVGGLDDLRHRAGLRRRWQTLVISSTVASPREQAVDDLVRRGYTTTRIADQLGVSPRTVTSDRARLRNRAAADATPRDRSNVAVAGRPSLARDLVHDCLLDSDLDVAPAPGPRPDVSVTVLVRPTARDFDVRPGVRIVSCGPPPESLGYVGAIRRGMVAVLPLAPTPREVTEAVASALRGATTFSADAVERLVGELQGSSATTIELSRRETDVLDAIRAGESMKQTARRLGISRKTVENLRRQLYQRLGARSAAEASAAADRLGIDVGAQPAASPGPESSDDP